MFRTLLHKTLLTALVILLGGLAAVAQHYVVKGTNLNFRVDEVSNYAYHWSVTHTTSGNVVYLPSLTHESGDYLFAESGDYEVKVYPEDLGTHCFGEALSFIVVVDGAAPTAVFDDLEVPYVCAKNNGGDTNGKINITVRYTGSKPWTFKYSVDRAPAVMPPGAEELYVNEFEFELEIPNTTGRTHRAEILLVEAQALSGLLVAEDLANQTLEVDVMGLPNTVFGDYAPVIQSGTIQTYTATIGKNENYEIFVPTGASVISESAERLSDNAHSELTFNVQWGTTAGDYQLKLIERTGFDCAGDTIYADVTLTESFVVSLGNDIDICEGQIAVLTPTIDFAANYTYLWSDGSTGPTLSVNENGVYSVTATDPSTGKSSSASVNVSVQTNPIVDLGPDYLLAEAETKVLDAGNPGMTYLWSTGATDQTITVSTSATYSVVVTNANACIGTDEIIITSVSDLFAIDLGEDKNICVGEEVVLNPNPSVSQAYNYLWSNGASTSTLTVSESGIYTVTVRDNAGNENTDEVEVIVHALPIVDLGENIVVYDGETANLDAGNPGSTYDWSTGESTQIITVVDENVYSVEVTNEFGCRNAGDVGVDRRDGHTFSVDLGGSIEICEGDRVYIEASIDRTLPSTPTYKWIPSESSEEGIFVNQTGKYCVEVTDSFGNMEGDCVDVTVNPTPVVDLGEDIFVIKNDEVTFDAENEGSFYRWSTDEISQSITVVQAGVYWVEVTNSQNCIGRDTVNMGYTETQYTVDIPTAFTPGSQGDANRTLQLFGDIDEIVELTLIVYNRLGHRVYQANRLEVVIENPWDGTFKGQKLDMDVYVYFLDVKFRNGSSLVKQGNVTLLY